MELAVLLVKAVGGVLKVAANRVTVALGTTISARDRDMMVSMLQVHLRSERGEETVKVDGGSGGVESASAI